MNRLFLTAAMLLTASAPAFAAPVAYTFDKSHAVLTFSYDHLGFSTTEGLFRDWDGKLMIDEEDPANSSIEFTIDINSMDALFEKRTQHFLSADFFDGAKYPKATFKSTKVEKTGDKELKVTGDLTIKDITKPVTLDVKVLKMGEHPMVKKMAVGFDVTGIVKRSDYGMDMYVPYVGDDVTVHFNAESEIADGK